ncbi:acetyl-CoA synthetase-like protein [Rhizopogon vinicolor AM-OR11-026]|uniref:Acetyl-CoA synthetase-like protein n=1 Tax=Rhizopogon vinicolor AM-OR11-026 TaxID=1314800 RepID=A0A1B7MM31_9AGAM|nr:acetyl-CoA synthetase-like protein [Rhizopogon vinicolor AM-OR11-026]
MAEIFAPSLEAYVPDDLTLPQFILDSHHPLRPVRPSHVPWFIDDASGRGFGHEEVRARTYGLANGLSLQFRIKDNDSVVIFSPNHIDYPVAIWATHRLGGVVSCANPAYSIEELSYQINVVHPSLIITHSSCLDTALAAAQAASLPSERVITFDDSNKMTVDNLIQNGLRSEPNFVERKLQKGEAKTKVAFLCFSSGTTGKPKAVAISHFGPLVSVIQKAEQQKVNKDYAPWEEQRFRPGDVAAGAVPFFHIYGLMLAIHFLPFCGISVVAIPKFNFREFLESIIRHRISHLMLVPPQIVLLCKHPAVKDYDLTGIRLLSCGAAPLSAELVDQVVKVLPNAQIGQGYGITEASGTIAMFSVDTKLGVPGSAGRLVPGIIAKVVKVDGTLAGFNEPGELQVKMPSVALGYVGNDEASKETFVNGWLRTGDEVIIREDLEVFIVDRLKEIMKVKGFQVAPAELEGCLLDHPDVADTCVVPIPDTYSGELPMAFVVLHPNAAKKVASDPAEAERIKASIKKHVADNKVAYKHLAGGVQFTDVIPKNPSGKLLRRVLRDRARDLVQLRSKL